MIKKKIIDFYIYSSLHIAMCAVALASFTFFTYGIKVDYQYLMFLGCGTLITYSLHRLIGIKKSESFKGRGRFAVAQNYKTHIQVYTFISALIGFVLFWQFDFDRKIMLIILSSIALLYVLPLLSKGRRIRDLPYIKIILIGLVWTGATVSLILIENNVENSQIAVHSSIQFLFILGITIPFDIRDLEVDVETGVKTIANSMSVKNALYLAYFVLSIAIILSYWQVSNITTAYSLISTFVIAILLIKTSWQKTNDYWFSGLLDGTMMIPMIAYLLIQNLILR